MVISLVLDFLSAWDTSMRSINSRRTAASSSCIYELLNLVLNENYYTLLLGLDGEAALGNVQNAYKLYDEEGNLLNECGEIEEVAYRYFMEK